MKLRWFTLALALAALPACAVAGPITITFTNSLITAVPNQTVTFSATVANTTASAVPLTSDAVNIAAPLTVNDSKFFLNFPASLAGNASVTAAVFDVFVPLGTGFGIYPGHFDIISGTAIAGSADFAVNVTPEPSTVTFLLLGGVALVCGRRLRR